MAPDDYTPLAYRQFRTDAAARERQADLAEAQVLGHVQRTCETCGGKWIDVDGVGRCERDASHVVVLERLIEPMVAEAIPSADTPHHVDWRPWRKPAPPAAIGPDAEAQEALRALDEAVSTVLVALGGADQACRASTSQLEAEMTNEAARGQSPTKREWKPGFRKAAATLRSAVETTGDVSPDSGDLPRLRQTLLALQLVVRGAMEEA